MKTFLLLLGLSVGLLGVLFLISCSATEEQRNEEALAGLFWAATKFSGIESRSFTTARDQLRAYLEAEMSRRLAAIRRFTTDPFNAVPYCFDIQTALANFVELQRSETPARAAKYADGALHALDRLADEFEENKRQGEHPRANPLSKRVCEENEQEVIDMFGWRVPPRGKGE